MCRESSPCPCASSAALVVVAVKLTSPCVLQISGKYIDEQAFHLKMVGMISKIFGSGPCGQEARQAQGDKPPRNQAAAEDSRSRGREVWRSVSHAPPNLYAQQSEPSGGLGPAAATLRGLGLPGHLQALMCASPAAPFRARATGLVTRQRAGNTGPGGRGGRQRGKRERGHVRNAFRSDWQQGGRGSYTDATRWNVLLATVILHHAPAYLSRTQYFPERSTPYASPFPDPSPPSTLHPHDMA